MALFAVAGYRLCAGLALPPLGHDALLYHYLKAGRWVATGGWVQDAAPGPWGSYEYFPFAGQAVWAWAMLPTHGDVLVAFAGVAAWGGLLLSAYAAARSLGAGARPATAFSVAVGAVPAISTSMTSGNVENLVCAFALLAVAFVARRMPGLAVLAVCMAAATKSHGLPMVAVGLPVVAAQAWCRRLDRNAPATCEHGRDARATVAVVGVGLLLGCVSYARAWWLKGSPLYPFSLEVGGSTFLRGNEEMTLLFSGGLLPEETLALYSPWQSLKLVFWGTVHETWQHINLGPGGALLLLAGVAGLPSLWGRSRAAVVLVAGCAAILFASILSPSMLGHRTLFIHMIGRFAALPLVLVALGALSLPGRACTAVCMVAALVGVAMSLPLGLMQGIAAQPALLVGLGLAATCAVVWTVADRLPAMRLRWLAASAIGLPALLGAVVGLEHLRASVRSQAWLAAADDYRPLYDMHPIDWRVARCWPIWAALDEEGRKRIAFTSGFADSGHNAGRYPLMGSRLQNTVEYVAPTLDGAPLEPRLAVDQRGRTDLGAWLAALDRARITHVVSVDPATVELGWMRARPDLFHPVISSTDGQSWAFEHWPPATPRTPDHDD